MKRGIKVRYIGTIYYNYLTTDNVYEVLEYSSTYDKIRIVNDYGDNCNFNIYDCDRKPLFIDATAEIRCEVIDEILN